MKTPTFPGFETPKVEGTAAKIKAFKVANNIWTYRADMARKDLPWSALWLKHPVIAEYTTLTDPGEIIAEFSIMLRKFNALIYSYGELTAIRNLCRLNEIPCTL